HVTENFACDVMHDLSEGVCKYDFIVILQYFLIETATFSVETLNCRIKMFPCHIESSNTPPIISLDDIKKQKLRLSASEMLFLTRYFSVIIGDLIPEGNNVWKLYLCLKKLVNILF